MFTVPAPCQRIFVSINRNVQVIALHACALVLHNADAHALYVQNRPIGEKRLSAATVTSAWIGCPLAVMPRPSPQMC